MSKPVIQLKMMGRFGNQLFQYAFARAVCEKHGFELKYERWIGDEIFQLGMDPCILDESLPVVNESSSEILKGNVTIKGYCQLSSCAVMYSKQDVKKWFKFVTWIEEYLSFHIPIVTTTAHRRLGDYFGYGYPVVSKKSYEQASERFNLGPLTWVTEEIPVSVSMPDRMNFLPDFWLLMKSKNLLRGNSSFSWWASSLADDSQNVYAPIVDFLEGGKEHDCIFVKGNWPRFTSLDFVQELKMNV